MRLSQLIRAEQILPNMRADEHWPAIEELVQHLHSLGKIDDDLRTEILASLKTREELVSTGVGYGVAIPHAFSDHVSHVTAVLGRSQKGIDFEALDGLPVHFVFLFIVPSKDHHLHLRTLAAIAKMFTNGEIRRRIGEASSSDEILSILDPKTGRTANA